MVGTLPKSAQAGIKSLRKRVAVAYAMGHIDKARFDALTKKLENLIDEIAMVGKD